MGYVTLVAEGPADAEAAKRICLEFGHFAGPIHITRGKGKLDSNIRGYNNAARFIPWLVLRDLNSDATCPPELVERLVRQRSQFFQLRIPVRALETWLLADIENFSPFLSVTARLFPDAPELLSNPKLTVVNLARQSRRRDIRLDMTPATGTSAVVGRGYNSRLIEFIHSGWRPENAAQRSESLRRCMAAVGRFPIS